MVDAPHSSPSAPSPLRQVAANVWTLEGEIISYFVPPFPGKFPYSLRSVVVRLADGSLFVHSPVQLTPAVKACVDGLGPVGHLVSPNKIHHLYLGDWARAYPEARVYASPGLQRKRPELRFSSTLTNEPEPAWATELDQRVVRGSLFMKEVVFLHRPSRTLLLGDLIENHEPALFSPLQRRLARLNHMLAPDGETPLNFRLTFWDRRTARADFEAILAWQPERVVVLHGRCAKSNGEEFLRRGFAWLLDSAGRH